jgi:glutamate-1-semialdehyde 2,1-aminomutase
LNTAVNAVFAKHGLSEVLHIKGHPSWGFITINAPAHWRAPSLKTALLYELHQRGVLTIGTHNISYAHTAADVAAAVEAYDGASAKIAELLNGANPEAQMTPPTVEPLFTVRKAA